jgi:hypothetical protein
VAGRRDRQEFGEALDDAENDGDDQRGEVQRQARGETTARIVACAPASEASRAMASRP